LNLILLKVLLVVLPVVIDFRSAYHMVKRGL